MLVKIRLKPLLLAKITKQPKSMHLGNSLVTADWQELEIVKKHVDSVQCNHWMELQAAEPVKKTRTRKKKDD